MSFLTLSIAIAQAPSIEPIKKRDEMQAVTVANDLSLEAPILIVEDDKAIRELLVLALSIEGFRTLSAENGAEALRIMKTQVPGLVLLDLMMPVMNGWDFLKAKNQDLSLSPIPVVVLSANAQDPQTFSGVKCCLKKPVELDDLRNTILKYRNRDVAEQPKG